MGYCENCDKEVSSRFCPSCGKEVQSVASTKDEIRSTIDELYALRAGLSLLSSETDEITQADADYNRAVENYNSKLNNYQKRLDDDYKKYSEDFENAKKKNKKNYEDLTKGIADYKYSRSRAIFHSIILFLLVAIVIACVVAVVYFDNPDNHGVTPQASSIVFGVSINLFIISIIAGGFVISFLKENIEWLKRAQHVINNLSNCGCVPPEEFDDLYNSLPSIIKFTNEYNNLIATRDALVNKGLSAEFYDRNTRISIHSKQGEEIYNSLVANYSYLLDERDWQNLDLIIYMYETGRADTIKEALHHVDKARQTEQIVQMVSSATQVICGTISRSFQTLENTMIKCASILSAQLSDINSTQNKILRDVSATRDVLFKALKAKSNVSSEQLAYDVQVLKSYLN